jgi:hypothetical protein
VSTALASYNTSLQTYSIYPLCSFSRVTVVMTVTQACMKMDETLYHVADKIKNFAVM